MKRPNNGGQASSMDIDPFESKRVNNFRDYLIKGIPKFPNNSETISELEKLSISGLLLYFFTWAYRFVPPRKRLVSVEYEVIKDKRWKTYSKEIGLLLGKVEEGEDLSAHLSLKAHKKGFTPRATQLGAEVDKWEDKDFLLTTMGYHHFHLSNELMENGATVRTDDVLFSRVTRDTFEVVGIFNHSVFERNTKESPELNAERKKLFRKFDEHTFRGHPPGTVVSGPMITTSGHALHVSEMASNYAYVLIEAEKELLSNDGVGKLYAKHGIMEPNKPRLSWVIHGLDLGLFCNKSKSLFVYRYGPI